MREKKEINIQIGERIKVAREEAKMTQEQLAERVDVSPQYISDLERGVVGISIATLKKVCLVLCVSSDRILFGRETDEDILIIDACSSLDEKHKSILYEIIRKFIEAMNIK